MNNYEKILALSLEEMAQLNVRLFYVREGSSHCAKYLTSDGSVFEGWGKEEAIEYELEWLKNGINNDFYLRRMSKDC